MKAAETAGALYHRWQELMSETANVSKEEFSWTTNELRNCLRSIEWDLEDLEETVHILFISSSSYVMLQRNRPIMLS